MTGLVPSRISAKKRPKYKGRLSGGLSTHNGYEKEPGTFSGLALYGLCTEPLRLSHVHRGL
jgi:hypothetical protein